jgi:predicted metal-dependent peptidase
MAQKLSEALENLTVARIAMLLKQPFFGTLAMKLDLIEVDKVTAERLTTAAVDGRRLWYNPEFIKTLSKDECMFLVAHEVLHCVFGHMTRRFDRDPKLWNMAADYVINATLIEAGFTMPKIGLYEKKYLNWTSEDVYDDLVENNTESKPTLDQHPGDPGYPGDDEGDGEGSSGDTEEERRKLEDEWKDAVIQAAQAAAGNVPAGIARLIRDITEPKMDWRQMLQMHLQSCVRTDYSWMKPNKRTFGMGITMPSMDMDDMVKVAIAIDTSGSISQEMLVDFLTEVKGIMDSFSGYEIHISCFDTEIYSYECFTNEDDLMSYEPKGGGGTDFMVWWRWAQDQEWISDVKKILFFTDGYPFGDWGIDDLCDTLWIVHGSNNEGPFGTTVFYEDHKKEQI